MRRLGYARYVAQGGDQGAAVTDAMGRQAPAGLLGIHLNFLREALGNVSGMPADSREERAALAAISTFRTSGSAYFQEQATRLQTIGYALLDSPVALAAWMLDHDTDSYYKISRAFVGGQPPGNLTRDHVLDNITLYWLTGTGASAARLYWEGGQAAAAANGRPRREMKLPAGVTAFPGEIFRAPRSWAEKVYPNVIYFHEADRGGHFAAWEEPQLFTEEVRAGFRPLRYTIARRLPYARKDTDHEHRHCCHERGSSRPSVSCRYCRRGGRRPWAADRGVAAARTGARR
ncbi:MAG: hypothetical protein ACRDN1_12315 [Trebonia sp.]